LLFAQRKTRFWWLVTWLDFASYFIFLHFRLANIFACVKMAKIIFLAVRMEVILIVSTAMLSNALRYGLHLYVETNFVWIVRLRLGLCCFERVPRNGAIKCPCYSFESAKYDALNRIETIQ
jgi:hypothetical protein